MVSEHVHFLKHRIRIEEQLQLDNRRVDDFQLLVFEHKVCMETWFLGNRKVFKNNPQNVEFNKLVRFYEGADGLKTGHTDNAGYCLAATAKRNGIRLFLWSKSVVEQKRRQVYNS